VPPSMSSKQSGNDFSYRYRGFDVAICDIKPK